MYGMGVGMGVWDGCRDSVYGMGCRDVLYGMGVRDRCMG